MPKQVTMHAEKLNDQICSGDVRFSQNSISDHTKDAKKEPSIYIGALAEKMKPNNWIGEVCAVRIGKNIVMLDHRRVVAAATTREPKLHVVIKIYDETEILPNGAAKRFNIPRGSKAVDAIRRRIYGPNYESCSQSDDVLGFKANQVAIRRQQTTNHYPDREKIERSLNEMTFSIKDVSSRVTQ